MSLEGRVALVTGGTGAIGSVIAGRLHAEGARVIISSRSGRKGRNDEGPASGMIPYVGADLTVESDVVRLYDTIVERYGRVDIVVNTVGGFVPGAVVARTSIADWDTMIALNLRTAFLSTREALRRMERQSYGRIVNFSAMTAMVPSGGKSAYTVSKAAVALLTRVAAEECKGTGITVNALAPSIVVTKANLEWGREADVHKWVRPEEIADIVCYLCSEAAGSITGTVVRCRGGV